MTNSSLNGSTRMPLAVWVLTLSAFAIGTAEFVIAGILLQVAKSVGISDGDAGNLITAYALAIVIGGPLLTLYLARFDRKRVLIGLMVLFTVGNLVSALTNDYGVLLLSRVVTGLAQGPFYGIGAVVATRMVAKDMAGRAVGQMFAGLTLANVLGVPAGAWIGNAYGWSTTFWAVAVLGLGSIAAIAAMVPHIAAEKVESVASQLGAFRNGRLWLSLIITVLGWTGFMTFYGYISPVAQYAAGLSADAVTALLVAVGAGLVAGNALGGRAADANLGKAQLGGVLAMIVALLIVGLSTAHAWSFVIASVVFGIASFANVPPMQMRVMRNAGKAPELAATANISAFNIANALGGIIGGYAVDHASIGASMVPFLAALVPVVGLVLLTLVERPGRVAAKLTV
ncbi:MFS transporter [Pseudomonas sp. KU43P]|uniref:MFS transporter n=1 Tax=Pseudomonas sp. KU43P TaxID=2487887 RepID=UPI0012A86F56|nr:MFS transporter [Pseudomonas sp. KU43P]BBH46085.1 MFS transporter [Pseudomonas sp. KU43P]